MRYKDAGVNIDVGTESVQRIKKVVRSTFTKNVLTDIGGFGALFDGTLLKPESAARVTTPRLMKDGKPAPYGYGNLFVFTEGLAPLVRISGSTSTTQVYSLYAPEEKAFVAVFSSLSTHFPNTPNPYFPGPPAKEIALMLAGKK